MTPLPSKARYQARQVYNPALNSVTAGELVRMVSRKKKHLSDFAIGVLLLAVERGELTKRKVDIFQSTFVRGAKLRKGRKVSGDPFLGPGGAIVRVQGIRLDGGDKALGGGEIMIEDITQHQDFEAWEAATIAGTASKAAWDSKIADTDDDATASSSSMQGLKARGTKRNRSASGGCHPDADASRVHSVMQPEDGGESGSTDSQQETEAEVKDMRTPRVRNHRSKRGGKKAAARAAATRGPTTRAAKRARKGAEGADQNISEANAETGPAPRHWSWSLLDLIWK